LRYVRGAMLPPVGAGSDLVRSLDVGISRHGGDAQREIV
jgi:hypothetical protein